MGFFGVITGLARKHVKVTRYGVQLILWSFIPALACIGTAFVLILQLNEEAIW